MSTDLTPPRRTRGVLRVLRYAAAAYLLVVLLMTMLERQPGLPRAAPLVGRVVAAREGTTRRSGSTSRR